MQQDEYDEGILIKQERDTNGSPVENNFSEDSNDVPMNLTNPEQSRRIQSELNHSLNSATVTSQYRNVSNELENNNNLKHKTDVPIADSMKSDSAHSDIEFPLCKKVRQAQQLKMSANNAMQLNILEPPIPATEIIHEMLMPSKIPSKRRQRRDIAQLRKPKYPDKVDLNSDESLALSQSESNDLDTKKDDNDFIIPRERFISICNMDRNSLDTYLNANEENSQDLELLQYFGEDKNKDSDCMEEDLGPASTSVPLLENYQLFNEGRNPEKNSDKLSQLRSMLEEKYNAPYVTSNAGNESVIKNLLQKSCSQPQIQQSCNEQMSSCASSFGSNQHRQNMQIYQSDPRTINSNDRFIPQSPNTRRKNFSFVPISAQLNRAKNINMHPAFKGSEMATSPFVSPRTTPVNKRANTFLSIQNPNADSKIVPVLGNNNTAFCRPHHFKMEPASAPQSPSMVQGFNYGLQNQQNQFQFQTVNTQGTNYNYPVESRSQSVPPHCTNTNMFNSYENYSSACSSVAPTPVPSSYQEFSDTNILDIFNNEQVQPSPSIKLEVNDSVMELLDTEILNQTPEINQSVRQAFVNSRSVPNTPLPYQLSYTNSNSFCPLGKSVPTTPVGSNGHNFRYSPELPQLQRTRDFLINGFNNNNNNVVNNNKILKDDDGNIENAIEELSNLDSSLLNNL